MEQIEVKKIDMVVMNLMNYFITEKDYSPMIIYGLHEEIWLENLDNDYKIIRIVTHHIHNKEQYDFDKFKLNRVIKQVKKKTLSFKVKVLTIYTDIEDDKLLNKNDVHIECQGDIKSCGIKDIFPDIIEKTEVKEHYLEHFIKVNDSINKSTEIKAEKNAKLFRSKTPVVTDIIIGICILVFIGMYIFGNGSSDSNTLLSFGANLDTLIKSGEYYRLITCMFLHMGIWHLLCNMYSLHIVGNNIESLFGKYKFLIIYFISGISGSILSIAFSHNTILVGASGAIFGLLGALLYFGYYYRTYLGNVMLSSVVQVILINLVIGFMIPGISNAAHIGGLIGGVLTTMMVGVPNKSTKRDRINGIILTVMYLAFISYLAFM